MHPGKGEHGSSGTGRRTFVKSLTAAGTLGGILVTAGSAAASDVFPHVSTRGHFDITWYGSVYLTDGHTDWDYTTNGDVPGLDSPAGSELLVYVHGWRNDAQDALDAFDLASTAMRNHGYSAPIVGYSWDSDTSYAQWWDATDIAERNGKKLAQFTYDYHRRNPDVPIRYVAHSLGARVVLRAIEVLNQNGVTDVLTSLSLVGGAADNDAVSMSGRYGPDIQNAVGHADNFWKDGDDVLQWAYSTAEFDAAVGEDGCEGSPPSNYEDHNVDYVPDHFSYYRPDEGCMGDVVAEF